MKKLFRAGQPRPPPPFPPPERPASLSASPFCQGHAAQPGGADEYGEEGGWPGCTMCGSMVVVFHDSCVRTSNNNISAMSRIYICSSSTSQLQLHYIMCVVLLYTLSSASYTAFRFLITHCSCIGKFLCRRPDVP